MNDFLSFLYLHFPHRWLDQKALGTQKLFLGLANIFEYSYQWVSLLQKNASLRSVEELIVELENEYGVPVNPSLELEFRRQRVLAKLRTLDGPVTKQDLTLMFQALGLEVSRIEHDYCGYQMRIVFFAKPEHWQILTEVRRCLEENVRAHIDYVFSPIDRIFGKNDANCRLYNYMISMRGRNLKIYYCTLDGSWRLNEPFIGVPGSADLNINCMIAAGIHNRKKNGYRLDGHWQLAGSVMLRYLSTLGIVLNSERNLQGIFRLETVERQEQAEASCWLTIDNRWRLYLEASLNGARRLNAQVVRFAV